MAMPPGDVVLVALAAGRGSRLGGVAKALLPIGATSEASRETTPGGVNDQAAPGQRGRESPLSIETYLARIAATARRAGATRGVAVVAPPYGEAVAAEARRLGLDVVENPRPERGMASSIELGFAWAARSGAAAALLWPCDHPAVQAATVTALLDELAAAGDAQAVVPVVAGRGGHPALISAALFPALARCAGEPEGARSVLRAAPVRRLEVADAGCTADIDEPADLQALAEAEVA